MVTIGAEDLVTRAEDLYGEGPEMIYYHKLLTRTILFLSKYIPQLGFAWTVLPGWGGLCVTGVWRLLRSSRDLGCVGGDTLRLTREGFLDTLLSLGVSRELSLLVVSSPWSSRPFLSICFTFLNWWKTDFCCLISLGEFLCRSMCFLLIFGLELLSTETAENSSMINYY